MQEKRFEIPDYLPTYGPIHVPLTRNYYTQTRLLVFLFLLIGCRNKDISYSPKSNPDYFIGRWLAIKDSLKQNQIWNFTTNKDLTIIFPDGADTSSYWMETQESTKFLLLQSKAADHFAVQVIRLDYLSQREMGISLVAYRELDSIGKNWVERPYSKPYSVSLTLTKINNK